MRILILTSALAPLLWAGCKQLECGDGTLERNGACVPADESTGDAKCGPFTMLVGDQCVPMFPPTVCDDTSTAEDVDTSTGVTTCVGTGGGGCGAPLPCPQPATGKQTICGQLYNYETSAPFADSGATGAKCAAATATGPCSLGIRAFDAISFATNPGAAVPLAVGETYIDDCGRYRVADITLPGGPFIGLGIDDAAMANQGPLGTTNTVGVATPKRVNEATKNFEGFVAPKSTTDKWAASGGPPISGGIYSMVFRASKTGLNNATGASVTRAGNPITMADDFYFQPAQTTRADIMAGTTATGANGTALVINASVAESLAYSGSNPALPAQCQYSTHAGAALPFILFIQIVRPIDKVGMTCPL